MHSKVHVLVAVRNGSPWLGPQLDTILGQEGVDVALTLSLDESTDDSLEICKKYADRFPNVNLLPPGSRFGSAGKNFFHLFQRADFGDSTHVACSDQDDIWQPDKLRRAVDKLSETNSSGYSSDLLAFDQLTGRTFPIRKNGVRRSLDYLFQGASAGCTYVFGRDAAEQIRMVLDGEPFKDMLRPSHDWALYAICRSHGFRWFFDVGYAGVLYRQHGGNAYGAQSTFRRFLKKCSMIRSGWYGSQIRALQRALQGSLSERHFYAALDSKNLKSRLWLLARVREFRREPTARLGLGLLLLFDLI